MIFKGPFRLKQFYDFYDPSYTDKKKSTVTISVVLYAVLIYLLAFLKQVLILFSHTDIFQFSSAYSSKRLVKRWPK